MKITLDVGGNIMDLADKFNFCNDCEMRQPVGKDRFTCLAIDTDSEKECISEIEVVDELKERILECIPPKDFE